MPKLQSTFYNRRWTFSAHLFHRNDKHSHFNIYYSFYGQKNVRWLTQTPVPLEEAYTYFYEQTRTTIKYLCSIFILDRCMVYCIALQFIWCKLQFWRCLQPKRTRKNSSKFLCISAWRTQVISFSDMWRNDEMPYTNHSHDLILMSKYCMYCDWRIVTKIKWKDMYDLKKLDKCERQEEKEKGERRERRWKNESQPSLWGR